MEEIVTDLEGERQKPKAGRLMNHLCSQKLRRIRKNRKQKKMKHRKYRKIPFGGFERRNRAGTGTE